MILEKFGSNKFDKEVILLYKDKPLTMTELKQYIKAQCEYFQSLNTKNIVLTYDNGFYFIVNFFAALFAKKEIYLLTDKNRFKDLKFDYVYAENIAAPISDRDIIFDTTDIEKASVHLFTSGSTAEPKTIARTFENIEVEAKAIIEEFKLHGKKFTVYSTTAMTHLFGLTMQLFIPLYENFIISTERIEFPEQLDNVKGDYFLVSTPAFVEKMAKYGQNFTKQPFAIYVAGDKLKDSVRDFFNKTTSIVEIYGSSETGVSAYKLNSKHFRTFKPVAFATDENNCIIIISNFLEAGRITISDVVEKISDREFDILGRFDRMVKIKDKRVSLIEIETILKKHPKVEEAYCLKHNENLVCAVVSKYVDLEEKELKSYLSEYSEIVPKKWRILDEIPKTATGKTDKEKIKHIFDLNLSYPFVFERRKIENGYEADLIFKDKSNFFKGHFDTMPILPGVVQLYFADWFIKEFFHVDTSKKEFKRIKFSNIIKSNQKVTLRITEKDSSFDYTYLSDDKVFSTGIFVK